VGIDKHLLNTYLVSERFKSLERSAPRDKLLRREKFPGRKFGVIIVFQSRDMAWIESSEAETEHS
jgi:hypothetical protein